MNSHAMSESLRKKVEEEGKKYSYDHHNEYFHNLGASFVYPLALEEGFIMAIELMIKNLDSFGCLEVSGYETQIRRLQEEGQRLGILTEEK